MYGILLLIAVVGASAECRSGSPCKHRLHRIIRDRCAGQQCQGCSTCGYGSYDYRILFDYPWSRPSAAARGPVPAFLEPDGFEPGQFEPGDSVPGDFEPGETPAGPALKGAARKPLHVVRKIHGLPSR